MPPFGATWDTDPAQQREHDDERPAQQQDRVQKTEGVDTAEALIDPALREDTKSSADPRDTPRTHSPAQNGGGGMMRDSGHRRYEDHRAPSPIGNGGAGQSTIPHSHSPSPSVASGVAGGGVDRSNVGTPVGGGRRSPAGSGHMPPPPPSSAGSNGGAPATNGGAGHLFQNSYGHDGRHEGHHQPPTSHMGHQPYIYAPPHPHGPPPPPPPGFDHRYDQAHHPHHHSGGIHSPYTAAGLPPGFSVPPPMAHHGYGHPYGAPPPHQGSIGGGVVGQSVQIIHTDDAATKLSDRVRRRCFNCCTTDTSTWRRSNLSPGKVLCNKCGLFERTHSRPRPEQFPHKRGPLATTSLQQRRTPPGGHGGHHHQFAPPPPPPHLTPIHSQAPQATHLPPLSGPPGQSPYQYNPPGAPPPGTSSSSSASSAHLGSGSHMGSPHLPPGYAPSSDRGPHSVIGGPAPSPSANSSAQGGSGQAPGGGQGAQGNGMPMNQWQHPPQHQPQHQPHQQQQQQQHVSRRDSHSSGGHDGDGHVNGSSSGPGGQGAQGGGQAQGQGSRVASPVGREGREGRD